MRHPVRRPRRLAVIAPVVALLAAAVLTTGPVALAAKPPVAGSDAAQKVGDHAPRFRGTVDVSRLPTPDASATRHASSLPTTIDPPRATSSDVSIAVAPGPPPDPYVRVEGSPASSSGGAGFDQTEGVPDHPDLADPWVAVGPDHVLQSVNTSLQIWDRNHQEAVPPKLISTPALFNLPDGISNLHPRFIYDALHGRWVGTEVSWTCDKLGDGSNDAEGYLDFIVSENADPTGIWSSYYYTYLDWLPDDPAAGASSDKLAFTADLSTFMPGVNCTSGMPYLETNILLTDWADVLAHGGTNSTIDTQEYSLTDDPGNLDNAAGYLPYRGAHVALQVPASSPTMHLLARHDGGVDGIGLFYSTITGGAVADTIDFGDDNDLNQTGVIGPLVDPPDPLQSDGSTVTPDLTSGPTEALWQNGRLTTVTNAICTPPTGSPQACVRVTQLDTPSNVGSAPTRRQDFLIGKVGADSYLGGIGMAGNGTLHVIWTESAAGSPGEDPSARTGFQLPTDSVNRLNVGPDALTPAIGGPYTGTAWGGYQGVAQDPQVPNAVWQGALYSKATDWATNVLQLQTGGATYVPIDPLRVLDSRIPLGVGGIFTASAPRTFQIAGFSSTGGSIPADAIAVTGNVTVTKQTAAGYVSITTTSTSTPRSSTINFPLGDTRANNVTASLAANGRLSAVYKAAAGKKAHILFDVTGYFLPGTEDAGYNTLNPIRVLDSRVAAGIGLTGHFHTGIPRRLTIAGANGIPDNAVAITANLTVVGQTKAGFVSVTPTSIASPATSNINFPVKDTRANGLTAKLGAGSVWLVYKGAAGSRTDLILDVTGFYLPAGGGGGLVFHALNPGRIMDTRTDVLSGLTGQFTHGAPRTLDTDGHWGVPVGAMAVTANLTVTGQTKAGFVSITPLPVPVPSTSTINFPLGDTRERGDSAAQRGQHEPRLPGEQRQEDPPDPGRDRLLRVTGRPTPDACAARRGSRSAASPRRWDRVVAPP